MLTHTHTHTLFVKIQKEKCDMIWYDMIWYDMIWYDMIWYDMMWYDIALYCQTGRKFFLHSSIYVYNNQHPLNNNIHFIHTRTKHIIHCKHYNMPYPFTTLIQLHHVHNTLDFFLFIIQELKFIIQDCLMHKRVFQHNFVKYWDSVPPVWL